MDFITSTNDTDQPKLNPVLIPQELSFAEIEPILDRVAGIILPGGS